MQYLLILVLIVGAYATPPDYLAAYSNTKKSSKLLVERMNFPNWVTVEQSNYAVLKSVVSGLADMEFLFHVKYDDIYTVGVLIAEVVGRLFPFFVRDVTLYRNDWAMMKTVEIRKIVEEQCFGSSNRKSQEPAYCNEVIQEMIQDDPFLSYEGRLLLALGNAGYHYLTQEPEFYDVAVKNEASEYVLNGRENLRTIVEQTLTAYSVLYQEAPKRSKKVDRDH